MAQTLALNIDADEVNADWLRIIARYRTIASAHPELWDRETFRRAVRDHLAAVRASRRSQ